MKTITITPKARASFLRTAQHAVDIAKGNRCLVRFTMGPPEHRQTFSAAPKKSIYTLSWEWQKSTAGQLVARAQKAARLKSANKSLALAS
jgi:hypothetical protein